MKTINQFLNLALCCLLFVPATLAQAQTKNAISQDVTIIIQQEQVRFTSQKPIQMMQLQIANQSGEQVYDSGPMTVAEINWTLQTANGEALKSGLYAYTLSIHESGAATARVRRGHFIVDRAQDRDGKTDKLWVTSQQGGDIGTELTVARNEDGTVAGTSTTNNRTSATSRDTASRDTAAREVTGKTEAKTPAANDVPKLEAASGTVGQIAKFTSGADLGNSVMSEANGNIGIGTNAPGDRFTVQTATGRYGLMHTDGNITFGSWVGAGHSGTPGGWFGTKSKHSLGFFAAGGAASLTISPSGLVGIRTDTPSEVLEVKTPTGRYGLLHTDGNIAFGTWVGTGTGGVPAGWVGTKSNHALGFYTANGPARMLIGADGNIGIGTLTPSEVLEVKTPTGRYGLLHSDGNISFGTWVGEGTGGMQAGWVGTKSNHALGFYTASGPARMLIETNGNVGIGTLNPQAELDVAGRTRTESLEITGGADFAENFDVNAVRKHAAELKIEAGMVVVIDPLNPGKLTLSTQAYNRRVAGIISGAGGVNPGMRMSQAGTLANGQHPVALSGRVYCWVDGAVKAGDLLTTSTTPGYAMKATNRTKAQGAILGKAMTSLKEGKGLVLVLVTLQ